MFTDKHCEFRFLRKTDDLPVPEFDGGELGGKRKERFARKRQNRWPGKKVKNTGEVGSGRSGGSLELPMIH